MHKIPWYRLPGFAALVALLVAWVAVIWVALQVSSTVLNTLDMIIELAAMTP